MATGDSLLFVHPLDAELAGSAFPQHGIRNNHPTLDFDAATNESADFTKALPKNYGGNGITIRIRWMAATATSGNCRWQVQVERDDVGGQDLDSDSFTGANTNTTAAPGTSGVLAETVHQLTNGAGMDNMVAGDLFRLRVTRDASNAGDTMTGDAQIVGIVIEET